MILIYIIIFIYIYINKYYLKPWAIHLCSVDLIYIYIVILLTNKLSYIYMYLCLFLCKTCTHIKQNNQLFNYKTSSPLHGWPPCRSPPWRIRSVSRSATMNPVNVAKSFTSPLWVLSYHCLIGGYPNFWCIYVRLPLYKKKQTNKQTNMF